MVFVPSRVECEVLLFTPGVLCVVPSSVECLFVVPSGVEFFLLFPPMFVVPSGVECCLLPPVFVCCSLSIVSSGVLPGSGGSQRQDRPSSPCGETLPHLYCK